MSDLDNSEINVDMIMKKIKEEVTKKNRQYPEVKEPEEINPSDVIHCLSDFIEFEDRDFIINAYRKILKREPDSESLKSYLADLQRGALNKKDIIEELLYSEEGIKKNIKIIPPLRDEMSLLTLDNISLTKFRRHPEFYYKNEYIISDFLQYNYEDFITYSFNAILKREASAEEKETCLHLLQRGHMSKQQLIEQLRYSPEGIEKNVTILGLKKRYLLNKLFKIPVAGKILEILSIIPRLPRIVKYIQGIDDTNIQRCTEIIDKINSLSADSEREINQKLTYLIRDENSNVQTLCSRLDKNIIPQIKDVLNTRANLNEVEELLEFKTEQLESFINLKADKGEYNPYGIWIIKNEPWKKALEKQKDTCLPWSPVITVIALINKKESFSTDPSVTSINSYCHSRFRGNPLCMTPASRFRGNDRLNFADTLLPAIESVIAQTYGRWELILINDAGDYRDERIKKAHTIKEAFSLCKGSFVTFINSSDRLSPFALFDILQVINKYPKSDFIYSDEDSISEDGSRHSPHFKPDWSPDTLRSFNYINHICLKKSLVDKVGTDYISDYDYILRASEEAKEIIHIPSILYHSRIKCINKEHDIKALKNHLERTGFEGNVEGGQSDGFYKVTYKIKDNPKISILIPTKDHAEDLKRCVTSITDKSTYKNLEIIIIENGSSEKETFIFYDELKKKDNIKIIKWEKPFNYSACNNFVAASSTGDILLFLNNDTEVINPDWLERMIEHVQRKEVGAVGAKLYYPDNSVQHGGVIIDNKSLARHLYRHAPKDDTGYFGRLKTVQNVSAVTGACLMVKKEVFEEAGRFDEKFALAFNDTDLCLKIRQMGYLIVWTPYAELYHYECKTRGTLDSREKVESFRKEQELFHSRWISVLQKGDPYFSPHLTLKEEDFFLLKEEGERKIYSSVEIELKI